MPNPDFDAVFTELRALMEPPARALVVVRDEPGDFSVNTGLSRPDGYQFAFGAVQTKARYVSYHLVPVYTWPDLIEDLSPALRKRMQGKSCFNFTKVDESLFAELGVLTGRGAERVRTAGRTPG